ncbi:hypothetical protein AOLI_G00311290 [Acnodon oligacanthus]
MFFHRLLVVDAYEQLSSGFQELCWAKEISACFDPLHTWTRPSKDGHRLNVFPLRDEIWYGSCTLHSPSTLKPRQK